MKSFRWIAIIANQLLPLLLLGAKFDLLFSLNRLDNALLILMLLTGLVPLLNLVWFGVEINHSIKRTRHQNIWLALLMPCLPILLFCESLAIDLYVLSQLRM